MSNYSDKNIHSGHRQRLLKTVSENGLEGLSDIQILEYILTYVIPRKDTNVTAHKLLDRYKTVSKVLEANYNDVALIDGMGETSAKRLCMFSDIFKFYARDRIKEGIKLKDYSDVYNYFWNLLAFTTVEEMHLVAVNSKNGIINTKCISRGNLKNVGIDLTEVSSFVTQNKAAGLFLTHSHPNGTCFPSQSDIDSTTRIEILLKALNVTFLDHIIVGMDGEYSFKLKKTLTL